MNAEDAVTAAPKPDSTSSGEGWSSPPPSDSGRQSRHPYWGLAALCGIESGLFALAAVWLPWRGASLPSLLLSVFALLHAATATLALLGPWRRLRIVWGGLAWASLLALAALSVALASAAAYLAEAYQGIGAAIAGMLLGVWGLIVLLTLPIACWGLARTRFYPRSVRLRALLGVAAFLSSAASVLGARAAARPERVTLTDPASVQRVLSEVVAEHAAQSPSDAARSPDVSLLQTEPVACRGAPEVARPTLLSSYVGRAGHAESACLQATSLTELGGALRQLLREHALPGSRVKLDMVGALRRLVEVHPVFDALELRPGIDGVCGGARCLSPWQLVALDAFTGNRPFRPVPDMSFGFAAQRIARLLGVAGAPVSSLVAVETWSFASDAAGKLVPLARLRVKRGSATPERIEQAVSRAKAHLLAAQLPDGSFRYLLDPFTGKSESASYSLARQAGTALVLCELAKGKRVQAVVRGALASLAERERQVGEVSVLFDAGKAAQLGRTALPLAAFVSCRRFVGSRYDALMGRLARALLRMQRADGSFFPELDIRSGEAQGSHESLYGSGQSVLALVLLEELAKTHASATFPAADTLRRGIDAAMDHYAQHWPRILYDFFFLEENWHCLAARAALDGHRRDPYERFCLDYVRFKSRLILRAGEGADPDFVGGYGLGNWFVPHSTSTSGFAEALAAAIAVEHAREQDTTQSRQLLEEVLQFVMAGQWDATSCFACTRDHAVEGGFSEHVASPSLRIDYVQHALAALGHGGDVLRARR